MSQGLMTNDTYPPTTKKLRAGETACKPKMEVTESFEDLALHLTTYFTKLKPQFYKTTSSDIRAGGRGSSASWPVKNRHNKKSKDLWHI